VLQITVITTCKTEIFIIIMESVTVIARGTKVPRDPSF
jgi:hypothetical protein